MSRHSMCINRIQTYNCRTLCILTCTVCYNILNRWSAKINDNNAIPWAITWVVLIFEVQNIYQDTLGNRSNV